MNDLINKKRFFHKRYVSDNELLIDRALFTINIFKENDCIRISKKHKIYLNDIINDFDFYFSSVEPAKWGQYNLVDFSKRKAHKVNGFDLHKIMFSSFAEPLSTTFQYRDFANLDSNSVLLDLGAYSGLTSIIFDQFISKNNVNAKGKVIAVDPDAQNAICIKNNLASYKNTTGRQIEYLQGAVWETDGEIEFSTEGNMGSSALAVVGKGRGHKNKVKAFTLSSIAKKYNLDRVDFIKCDIEGAEIYIFQDEDFFKTNKPKIIMESHFIDGNEKLSSESVAKELSKYGYTCKEVYQDGTIFPLLECYPPTES